MVEEGVGRVARSCGLERLDTPGALFLCDLRDKGVKLDGVRDEHRALLDLVCGLELEPLPKVDTVPRWRQVIIELGKGAHDARHEAFDLISFVGRAATWTAGALIHPSRLRPASISRHVAETGIKALPIVGLMAVMIAVVLGYQGVAQLRPFGGEDYTINLVAVSVLREMGVLITAIMVAGRSGSAFAAEIGVMQTRGGGRAQGDGDRAHARPGRAAGDRPCHHPAAARVLRRHHGPRRRRRHLPGPAQCLADAVPGAPAVHRRRQRPVRRPVQGARLRLLHRRHRLHARAAGKRLGGERRPGDHASRGEIHIPGHRARRRILRPVREARI